jgi:hypothetical protein
MFCRSPESDFVCRQAIAPPSQIGIIKESEISVASGEFAALGGMETVIDCKERAP